ncbi:MAG TPA: hypothetical protein VFM29_01180 [Vicinamibacteria bacterium]|nr:hypothetical protein [Vicinamibacteria bacterium]
MTSVFFLFLVHLSVGVLATLPLVTDRAGSFFKFCSASAAFMSTAGLWLLWRRYGASGSEDALGGDRYPLVLAVTLAFILLTVVYNRALHFGWDRARRPLLYGSLAAGLASVAVSTPAAHRGLALAADLTSVVLLGAAASAMVLGHWYLVVLDLPISALRRLTVLLGAGLLLRAVAVGLAFFLAAGAWEGAREVALGLWSPDGVFVWMRLLFGILGPLSLLWFIWKTVEIRSTQSATGILYVQLFLVLSGELLAKYLRVAAGVPL